MWKLNITVLAKVTTFTHQLRKPAPSDRRLNLGINVAQFHINSSKVSVYVLNQSKVTAQIKSHWYV